MSADLLAQLLQRVRTLVGFCLLANALIPMGYVLAQIPASELHWLSRQAAQTGKPIELSLQGSRLDELNSLQVGDFFGKPLALTASPKFSARRPLQDWDETTGEFSMEVGSELKAGLIEIRALGRLGASNSRPFLLCENPVVLVSSDHNSMLTALDIEFGTIVNAHAVALQSKYFRLSLQSGERLHCVVYCKQLDSQADLHLRFLDDSGFELHSARTLGYWPAELSWENSSNEPETVFVEIRDLLARGGPQFSYLLECGRTRMSADVGTDDGHDTSKNARQFDLHLDELLRPRSVVSQDRHCSRLPLAMVDQPSITAGQHNTSTATIKSIAEVSEPLTQFPVVLHGDLRNQCQVDFIAHKGQVLVFDVGSSKWGQLTDPGLVIYKYGESAEASQQLRWIGDNDDAAYCGTTALRIRQTDPNWVWTAPDDGKYQLRVVDNQSGTRPADSGGFLLTIRPPAPGFSLITYREHTTNDPATAKPLGNGLMRNGTDRLHVTVIRHDGFAGPVEVSVTGLPENCTCHPVIVQAGATEGTLVIQSSADIGEHSSSIQVLGSASVGSESVQVESTLAAISSAAIPTYNTVQSRRSGQLDLTTVPQDSAALQLHWGDGTIIEAKPDSKISIPLKLVRAEGANAEVIVRPQDLPPKIALSEIKVPGDQTELNVELVVPSDTPAGEYTFWALAESRVKWQVNPQALLREQQYLAKLQAALAQVSAIENNQSNQPAEVDSSQDKPIAEEISKFSKEQIESTIAASNQRIEQLKTQCGPQDIVVWVPTNTVRIRITP